MKETRFETDCSSARLVVCNTAIVGTGAAGYNAADRLWQLGQKDIVIVTENRLGGTSRNTGSDKQTYYKLTLAGGEGDSVHEMAETLFSGGCVDGDLALCEAALSAESFFRLAGLGVDFPQNRYGEYIGYKTDHDPRQRATSVGPYTSRQMTERLEEAVLGKGIPVLDFMQVIQIISSRGKAYGLLCLNNRAKTEEERFLLIRCNNIIYATGGPAAMYESSAYPASQYGASGLAFEAGVMGKNLTEWQYGLASVHPRWNVSGTYMQALPRVFSAEADGSDEREFLMDHYSNGEEMLSNLFLKGYQWPFDVKKLQGGSSVIDLLVYEEQRKGRRVYLDYRVNPAEGHFKYAALEREAGQYLTKAGACFGTPIERLLHMNEPAVAFYKERGVDLAREPLEIALCAQHNNGGLSIDCWWQTNLEGFFAVGEAAGSHGIYRPGGTALNAGQVGSLRAARYIAAKRGGVPQEKEEEFSKLAAEALKRMDTLAKKALERGAFGKETGAAGQGDGCRGAKDIFQESARMMSLFGGPIRNIEKIRTYLKEVEKRLENFCPGAEGESELGMVFRLRDMLLSQQVYLSAMINYVEQGGGSRGSAFYIEERNEMLCKPMKGERSFEKTGETFQGRVQEVLWKDGKCNFAWRDVRPIPKEEDFFENVWRTYRENGNIVESTSLFADFTV